MNKVDRARITRATNEGRNAFVLGLEESANPYKVSDWGVGGAWLMGWNTAQNEYRWKREAWEKIFSRMLLCQIGFDLATFRSIAGETVLTHLFNLYPDDLQNLIEDFDFTEVKWIAVYEGIIN